LGLSYEELKIPNDQSAIPIHGYWLPASDEAPVALYLHGQEVTRHNNLHHAKCLNDLGCNVLVIDYRGYGETFGKMNPTEESVRHDAEVAWDYLTGTLEFAPERILIYGHSLGGAIAIDLATRNPEAGGLVTESTFTSVKNMARWKNPLTYLLPLGLLLRHEFDSVEKIREKELPPVLFIHGTADSKVPYFMCKHLHDAARGPFKDMVLIKGGEHADRKRGQTVYKAKVAAFLNQCFGP
jgi:pimeloyl-ACP methyl ester carboxylesterase